MIYLLLTICLIISAILFPTFFIHMLVRLLGKVFFKVKVSGIENIPEKGGALLVANHISYLDFIITTLSIKRPVRFVMYKDIFEKRFLRILLKKLKMIPISPRGGQNDLETFNQTCRKLIQEGELIIIFSEGTVTRNGQIQEFKRGIEHIANGLKEPIIPIYLGGLVKSPFSFDVQNDQFWKLKIKYLRKKVQTHIGKPLYSPTTAFEIRQNIIELEAQSYEKRIPDNCQIINALDKKNNFSSFQNKDKKQRMSLKTKVIHKALQFQNQVKDYLEIGLLIQDEEELFLSVLAMNLLGKTPVIFNPQKTRVENMKICRKFHLYAVITDVDYTISHQTIQNIQTSSNIKKSKILSKFSIGVLKKYFNNSNNKWSKAVILTDDGIEKFTHQQIVGLSIGLSAVNPIKKYGNIASVSPISSPLGYLTKVISPLITIRTITSGIENNTNTVIGKTSELLKIKDQINSNQVKYVISDEFADELIPYINPNTELLKGSGIHGITPILSLNVPNYKGKDIAGKELNQLSNKPNTSGRFIPGIAYRIMDPKTMTFIYEPNKVGKLFIKSVNSSYDSFKEMIKWIDTGLYGKIDPQGFLELI